MLLANPEEESDIVVSHANDVSRRRVLKDKAYKSKMPVSERVEMSV